MLSRYELLSQEHELFELQLVSVVGCHLLCIPEKRDKIQWLIGKQLRCLAFSRETGRVSSQHLNKFPRGNKTFFPAMRHMDFSFIPTRYPFSCLTKDLQWQLKWFPNRDHTSTQ